MRIYIHGGMHKTATTSLQQLLYRNGQLLCKHGIAYPDFGRPHHHRILSTKEDSWSPSLCLDAIERARSVGAHTLVLSAEGVSILSEAQYRKLGNAFRGHDLTYLFCLRHWSSYLPSRWSQYCRRRDCQTFAEYVEQASNPVLDHVDLRFDYVLEWALASAECAVKAVSYDNARAEGGVLPALLRAMEFDNDLIDQLVSQATWANRRDQWERVELTRLFNGIIAGRRGLRQNELFLSIGENGICTEFFDLPGRIAKIDSGLLSELEAIVADCSRTVSYAGHEGVEIAERLNRRYGSRFTNRLGSEVFATKACTDLTVSDLRWEEFEALVPDITEKALLQIAMN